jgi:hypothetical protein
MARVTHVMALLGLAVVPIAPLSGQAQTLADFDACNLQAQAKAASPSASPGTRPGDGSMTAPGSSTEANRQPNASGRMSGSAGSPGTGAGTTSGGLSGMRSGGAADVQLRGLSSAGMADEAYKRAYRDCMKARGF